jgi:hypothetical protein
MVCSLTLHNKEAEPVCFNILSNSKTLCARPPRRIHTRIFLNVQDQLQQA